MEEMHPNRRKFIKEAVAGAAGLVVTSALPFNTRGGTAAGRIRFAVIGLNHGHIYGQTEAVLRGGGELASFYAPEADLAAAFAKRYPQARQARSEKEVLEDKSVQLVVSASIPNERAPLGLRVMEHGKD
ncbi:MAG TPA: gfo/Idh/MocA family oxidoreductase, partial [Cytophagales bacterium]